MSRRSLVLAITALAVAGFAFAGFIYNRPSPSQPRVVALQASDALVRPHSPVLGRADGRVGHAASLEGGVSGVGVRHRIRKNRPKQDRFGVPGDHGGSHPATREC